jgi:hypothetical protein
VVFVVAAPFLQRWVTVFLRGREKKTVQQLLEIAAETPLSPAAADALRGGLLKEKRARLDERRSFEVHIAELNAQIDQLVNQVKSRAASAIAEGEAEVSSPKVDDETAVKSLNGVLSITEGDLVGVPQIARIKLPIHGITAQQAQALYTVREEAGARRSYVERL